jgi:hypothetical protein
VFGSNFDEIFGIPAFPFQGADAQGGMLGANIQPPDANPNAGPAPLAGAPPAAPPSAAGPAALGAANPLGGGPLASAVGTPPNPPGINPQPEGSQPPPAAGIGSPFGKPQL